MSFFNELKRRNVFRVGIAYVVLAWLVAQVMQLVFESFTAPDWVMKVILVILAVGLLFALFFAWAFELTPEGLKKEKDVDRTQSITHQTGRRLDFVIIGILAVALGYFVYDKFVLGSNRDAALVEATTRAMVEADTDAETIDETDKSIAVLPFVNMSDDASNEFFSDGISEELLNLLARIPQLRVTSRSSAFAFKGEKFDIAEVANKLNVAHVLEGSVRKSGNQVRITAQLIDASTDTHLWSETYDRTLDNVFAIQDEIAATVVQQLKITLLGEAPRVSETDPEAYSLYLQGRQLGRLGSADGFEQSIELYEQVLAIDPDYVPAWDGTGTNRINQAGNGLIPAGEGYEMARAAIIKALSIDPDYGPAEARLGWIAMVYENDLSAAARHFQRGLELDPGNLGIIANSSAFLMLLGRIDEAVKLLEYAIARDPLNPNGHYNLGVNYTYGRRWDEAINSTQAAIRLSPGYEGAWYVIGYAQLMKGENQAALEAFMQEQNDQYRTTGLALAYQALGRQAEHEQQFTRLIDTYGAEWPTEIARVYAFKGDADQAFAWLDKAAAAGQQAIAAEFLEPVYTTLHEDPRWAAFLERVGSSPGQLAAIKFKVTLPGI